MIGCRYQNPSTFTTTDRRCFTETKSSSRWQQGCWFSYYYWCRYGYGCNHPHTDWKNEGFCARDFMRAIMSVLRVVAWTKVLLFLSQIKRDETLKLICFWKGPTGIVGSSSLRIVHNLVLYELFLAKNFIFSFWNIIDLKVSLKSKFFDIDRCCYQSTRILWCMYKSLLWLLPFLRCCFITTCFFFKPLLLCSVILFVGKPIVITACSTTIKHFASIEFLQSPSPPSKWYLSAILVSKSKLKSSVSWWSVGLLSTLLLVFVFVFNKSEPKQQKLTPTNNHSLCTYVTSAKINRSSTNTVFLYIYVSV